MTAPLTWAVVALAASHWITPAAPVRRLQPRQRITLSSTAVVLAASAAGGLVFLWAGTLSIALAGMILALTAAGSWREISRQRADWALERSWAQLLGVLAADMRAGATISMAFDHAAAHLDHRTAPQLRAALVSAAALASQGLSLSAVLGSVPGGSAIAHVLDVGQRHGLPLADMVEQAQRRYDTKVRHRVLSRAALQGPQATAVVLSLLPLAGIGLGSAMGARPLSWLLGGGLGGVFLVVGVGLSCAGFSISQRIIAHAAGAAG